MLTLKIQAKTINDLFTRKQFFEDLCNESNNDINEVITNISKIINYYLTTNDLNISYSTKELLKKANIVTDTNPNILFHPSNSYYIKNYRVNGLNSPIPINTHHNIDLEKLDESVSLFPTSLDSYYTQIYQSIEQSIIESFTYPNILYKSILKQPKGGELPLVVGATETSYYQSILDIRLKNIQSEYFNNQAKIGKKAISYIVSKDPLIVLFPKKTKRYSISNSDIKRNTTDTPISPIYLSYIRIPSKYKLLSICATNKQLCNGKLLDINTGQEYIFSKQLPPSPSIIKYSRYEEISITDTFEYCNTEFTGDINYDIDLIYGQLDGNKSRKKVQNDFESNIKSIKQKNDIIVRKIGNKYEIRNGRHRILYLKYFYISNYEYYKEQEALPTLKKQVTIPMNVESTIQDQLANEYLLKIYYLYPEVQFYKTDINNDNPNIIIILNNKIYSVDNTLSIIELYNLFKNNIYNNKYYIGKNDSNNYNEFQRIFDYLVITLKEKIYNMDLLDIINYLINNGITINESFYNISQVNIQSLYTSYIEFQHKLQLQRIFKTNIDLIKKTSDKYKLETIGNKIMSLLKENPKLIELSWDDLYSFLISKPELSQYDEELLKDSANYSGYQELKLEYIFKENNKYTKGLKIW